MLYKDIAPLVAVDAMGAPMPRIVAAVAQAANEFFRLTMAYKLSLPPVTLYEGQRRVSLQLPVDTFLAGVLDVRYGGKPIGPANSLPVDWENQAGTPASYLVASTGSEQDYVDIEYIEDEYLIAEAPVGDSFNSIRLVPYQRDADPNAIVTVEYAVAPILTATSVPDGVGFRYQHALVSGAKAYVLGDVDRPWSNPGRADVFARKFQAEINAAMIDARNAGMPHKSLRVRMRRT